MVTGSAHRSKRVRLSLRTLRRLYGAVEGGVALARVATRTGLLPVSIASGRAQFNRTRNGNVESRRGVTSHLKVGFRGTRHSAVQYVITDAEGVQMIGARSQQHCVGLFPGKSQVGYFKAWRMERALGLERGSLMNGFRVTEARGISGMHPTTPVAGNSFFRGPGVGLPKWCT